MAQQVGQRAPEYQPIGKKREPSGRVDPAGKDHKRIPSSRWKAVRSKTFRGRKRVLTRGPSPKGHLTVTERRKCRRCW